MDKSTFILFAGLILLLQGCAGESFKRTSFETLQNIREQQCDKDLTGKCPPREGYGDYQRKRKEAHDSDNEDKTAASLPPDQ